MNDLVHWVEVHRCRQLDTCQEFALVLAALGFDHRLESQDGDYCILTPAEQAGRAVGELTDYAAEYREWPPAEPRPGRLAVDLQAIAGYWIVLLGSHHLAQRRALALDWLQAGRAHAGSICQGEWWRTITALTLHADGPHLFNNLLFGALFGILLTHELGRGLTWFSILLAGAAGNALNACLQRPEHLSVGASTGIFGAVGLLVVLQLKRFGLKARRLRRWAPLIIGVVLLGYLGTAGERTDVAAHLLGMTTGIALGMLLSCPLIRGWATTRPQWLWAWAALLLVGLAWLLALR